MDVDPTDPPSPVLGAIDESAACTPRDQLHFIPDLSILSHRIGDQRSPVTSDPNASPASSASSSTLDDPFERELAGLLPHDRPRMTYSYTAAQLRPQPECQLDRQVKRLCIGPPRPPPLGFAARVVDEEDEDEEVEDEDEIEFLRETPAGQAAHASVAVRPKATARGIPSAPAGESSAQPRTSSGPVKPTGADRHSRKRARAESDESELVELDDAERGCAACGCRCAGAGGSGSSGAGGGGGRWVSASKVLSPEVQANIIALLLGRQPGRASGRAVNPEAHIRRVTEGRLRGWTAITAAVHAPPADAERVRHFAARAMMEIPARWRRREI